MAAGLRARTRTGLRPVPAAAVSGDAPKADRWLAHVAAVFPSDVDHLIAWFAHRVQRPTQDHHVLVLGGMQGIGKDTLLEPIKAAIGAWNFVDVSPQVLLGRFNGFAKAVILRISEARDLGDVDRYAFYDRLKGYAAAPPDVLRVDEKNPARHVVWNVCGVVLTTNYRIRCICPRMTGGTMSAGPTGPGKTRARLLDDAQTGSPMGDAARGGLPGGLRPHRLRSRSPAATDGSVLDHRRCQSRP